MFDSNRYVEYQKMEEPFSQKEEDEEEVDQISTPGASENTDGKKIPCCENHSHECPGRPSQVINLHIHMAPSDFAPGEAPTLIDEDNPRFRCCCHKIHVTRGAFLIGLVELVFAGFNLVDAIRNAAQGVVVQTLMEVLFATIFIVVVVLMVYGVRKEKKAFLIPHLIWSVLFSVIAVVLSIILLASWFFAAAHLAWALLPNQDIGPSTNWETFHRNNFSGIPEPDYYDEPEPIVTPAPTKPDAEDWYPKVEEAKKGGGSRKRRVAKSSQSDGVTQKKEFKDASERAKYEEKDFSTGSGVKKTGQTKNTSGADPTASSTPITKEGPVSTFLWVFVIIMLAVFIILVVLQIWFFITIRACYLYLKAKETNLNRAEMAVLKPLRAAIEEATEHT